MAVKATVEETQELNGNVSNPKYKTDQEYNPESTAPQSGIAVAQATAKVKEEESSFARNAFANALKGTASGALVQVDDVSPIEHTVACKARSKNLYNTDSDYAGYEYGYADGTLNILGRYAYKFILLEEEKTYTFSCKSTRTGTDGGGVNIRAYTEDQKSYVNLSLSELINTLSPTVTVTMPKGYPCIRITLYGFYATTGSGTATYTELMLEEGTEATAYVPYVDTATVKVSRCRKNLAYPNMHTGKVGGYTYKHNEDGSVTISGAATTTSQHVIGLALKDAEGNNVSVKLKANQTYTLTIRKNGEKTTGIGTKVVNADGSIKWGFDKTSTQDRELALVYVQFTPEVGDTDYCGTYSVQLELGDIATDYEPYEADCYTPEADGTVEGVTSVSPTMTLFADTANVLIDAEYNKDTNKVIEKLINAVAALGGSV